MNEKVKQGRDRTILISLSIILMSIYIMFFYRIENVASESSSLTVQLVRLAITIVLLFLTYKGKNWARVICVILFFLAVFTSMIVLVTLEVTLLQKTPFFVMTTLYSIALFHFTLSNSFKEFSKYQSLEKPKKSDF